jgi:hypothetical protein
MTSLQRLAPCTEEESGKIPWDRQKYTHRLAQGVDVELDGRMRRVRIVTFHLGSLGVRPRAALKLPSGGPIRRMAEDFLSLLPTVDGVVFVASSSPIRRGANAWTLEQTLGELSHEGVDVARLPVAFQLNGRDHFDAVPFATLEADLQTARCAHVESIGSAGAGVREALATLARMIDQPTDGARGPTPARVAIDIEETTPEAPPPSGDELESLFRPCVEPLFRDGSCRQRFTIRIAGTLVSTTGAFLFGQRRRAPAVQAAIPRGRYALEIASREIEFDDAGGVSSAGSSPLAARLDLGGTTTRFEPVCFVREHAYPTVVFGDELALRALHQLEQDEAARDAWIEFSRSGVALLRATTRDEATMPSILGIPIAPPWALRRRLELAHEGETAMFDTRAWDDEPIRVFWGYGAGRQPTSFVVLGEPGWQTILRRRRDGVPAG